MLVHICNWQKLIDRIVDFNSIPTLLVNISNVFLKLQNLKDI